jgi:type III restriction enzyme
MLIRNLREDAQRELARAVSGVRESRPENYLIRHLIEKPQVDYDSQAELLYRLAGQVLDHLRGYLDDEEEVENVALVRGRQLADFVFTQMLEHYRETPADYRAKIVRSFRVLQSLVVAAPVNPTLLDINTPASPLSETRRCLFKGSRKSPFGVHRFHSDAERRFAALIHSTFELDVLRWLKPGPREFSIEYQSGRSYEPDFVVETTAEKLIVEVKSDAEMTDPIVNEKARAAVEWVRHANQLAREGAGKPWAYLPVPDSAIDASATLSGVRASCSPDASLRFPTQLPNMDVQ